MAESAPPAASEGKQINSKRNNSEDAGENGESRRGFSYIDSQFLKDNSSSKETSVTTTLGDQEKNMLMHQPAPSVTASTSAEERPKFSYNWTLYSHVRLLFAIFDFATKKASPKKLMKLMSYMPNNLTSEHVKSHLQKFRVHFKKTRDPEFSKLLDALEKEDKVMSSDQLQKALETYPVQNCVMDYFKAAENNEPEGKKNAQSRSMRNGNENVVGRKRSYSSFNNRDGASTEENLDAGDSALFEAFMPQMMQKHQQIMKQHERNRLRYSYKAIEHLGQGDNYLEEVSDVVGAFGDLIPSRSSESIGRGGLEIADEDILEDIVFCHAK